MGYGLRIFARKTNIVTLGRDVLSEFLDSNHLQGSDGSRINYGLEHGGELVAVMTFGASRFNRAYDYELLRFCNKTGLNVVGGASRLLHCFRDNYDGSIISYADKRYSSGNLYNALGFRLDGETDPSFSYVKISDAAVFSRLSFQKKSLVKMDHYSDDRTEYEIMQLNGYDRIWDAGQYRFVMDCT